MKLTTVTAALLPAMLAITVLEPPSTSQASPDDFPEVTANFMTFAARWAEEPIDSVWAPKSNERFRAMFEGFIDKKSQGVVVSEVICKTTWCRVKLSYGSAADLRGYGSELLVKWSRTKSECEFHYPGDVPALLERNGPTAVHDIFLRCMR